MRRLCDESFPAWPIENEVAIEVGGVFTDETLCRMRSQLEMATYWLGTPLAIEVLQDCKGALADEQRFCRGRA